MHDDVTRRDFLKYTLATGALAAGGQGPIATALAQASARVTEVDKLTVWVLTDNYFDSLRPDLKAAKRSRAAPGRSVHAEHGISFFVEAVAGGKTACCMYDFGLDPVGLLNNVSVLGIDLGRVEAFSLSHGHFDHYTSAASVLRHARPRIAPGTPFYVGEEAFARRYALRPGAAEPADLGQLRREDIEGAGLKIVEGRAPTEIVPGAYLTGAIARVTPYEKGSPAFQVRRGEKLEHDAFPGEQGLFFHVRGKGLVVLSGCAHAGIVNTVRQAQRSAGTERVHAILGGFHLANAKPELVQSTLSDIKAMKPEVVVPAHCTGFEAVVAFARELPDAFILNTAGTQYTFAAPAAA